MPLGERYDSEADRRLQDELNMEVPADAELIAMQRRGELPPDAELEREGG
jgi:hypothetical protein